MDQLGDYGTRTSSAAGGAVQKHIAQPLVTAPPPNAEAVQGPVDTGPPVLPRSGWNTPIDHQRELKAGYDRLGTEPGGVSWKTQPRRPADTGAQPMYGVVVSRPLGDNPDPGFPVMQPMYGVVAPRNPIEDPWAPPTEPVAQPMYGVVYHPPTDPTNPTPTFPVAQPMYGVVYRPPSEPTDPWQPPSEPVAQPMYGVVYRPPTEPTPWQPPVDPEFPYPIGGDPWQPPVDPGFPDPIGGDPIGFPTDPLQPWQPPSTGEPLPFEPGVPIGEQRWLQEQQQKFHDGNRPLEQ